MYKGNVDYSPSVTDLTFVMGCHSTGSFRGGENGFNLTVHVIKDLSSLNSLMWISRSLW